jgi:hypothetical protein
MGTEHIEAFKDKINKEAPRHIQTRIGEIDIQFVLRDSYFDQDSLLEYDVKLPHEEHVLQIQHWYDENDPDFHRIEVRMPNLRAYQITCFHCKTVGLLEPKRIVEIEQIVKVSGQRSRDGLDVQQTNEKIKEEACSLLDQEGLLIVPDNRAPRWHIGTYDTRTRTWLYGQTTAGFIKNFLKVALIMAYCRGNRGINLFPNVEANRHFSEDEGTPLLRSISPEEFKKQRAKWEDIGLMGEQFIVQLERQRLLEAGRPDLAEAVQHVSLYNCGAGYDILSYELDGRPRYIECKSSVGNSMKFEITSNEWEKAKKYREQYYLYRVINADEPDKRDCFVIQDPYGKFEGGELILKPSSFTASLI